MRLNETTTVYRFRVTETLQNGNERTKTVKVFSHGIIDYFKVEKAKAALKEMHYYDIELVTCEYTKSLFID